MIHVFWEADIWIPALTVHKLWEVQAYNSALIVLALQEAHGSKPVFMKDGGFMVLIWHSWCMYFGKLQAISQHSQ